MNVQKVFLFSFFLLLGFTANAQTQADLNRKKAALERDINQLQKKLNDAEKNKKLTLTQVNALRTQINLRQRKIETINSEVRLLDNQISENNNKVRNLQGQLNTLKKEYASMIRFAQRNRNAYDKMMFIFAAHNFNQAYKRVKYLQQFSEYRKKQAGYIESKKKDLSVEINALDKNLKEKSTLLSSEQQERQKLQVSRDKQTKVLNNYTRQEKQFKSDLAKRKTEQASIDRQLKAAIARDIAEAKKRADAAAAAKAKAEGRPVPTPSSSNNSLLTASPEAIKLNAALVGNKGSLPWPVENKLVTEKFGKHKVDAATYTNDGIKIQTNDGANVRAVFEGEVSGIAPQYNYFIVLINHGQYYTVYQGLKSVSVKIGDKVSTRQNIGKVGTGDAAELSFQIHKVTASSTIAENPELWLAR